MRGFLYIIVLLLSMFFCRTVNGKPKSAVSSGSHPLLIISFDGFRWNYLDRMNTPNFDHFIEYGVQAVNGLKNAFVTKTFPNHFTLVTGLWEESHGIVANEMYDPVLNQTFTPSNKSAVDDPKWFSVGAEPIWVTNQLQREDGKSGVIMWVGGGAPIKWVQPSRYIAYDASIANETKIDTLIEWFMDEYPINLGLLYFDQPDHYGHKFGPESEEVTRMIGGLDSVVGYLLDRLKENGLLENMNIILTSDHGFTGTPKENVIDLDTFIDPESYMITTISPIASIWPHSGKSDDIYVNLTKGASLNGNFRVYWKEDIPEYYHYSHNMRISPIVVVAADTYSFSCANNPYNEKGNHGYDNRLQDMHPFFLAMGPSFKQNVQVQTFNSVDVYPLMCHLLDLTPAPNNGSLEVVSKLLVRKHETKPMTTFVTYIVGVILIAGVAGVFGGGACRYHRYLKRTRNVKYSLIRESSGRPAPSTTAESNRPLASGTGTQEMAKDQGVKKPLLSSQDDEEFS